MSTIPGSGGKVASSVGGDGAGDTIVVALHGLVHALGERQVRDGVVGIEQGVCLAVQCGLLGGRCTAGRPATPQG